MTAESELHTRTVIIDTDNNPLSVVFEMRGGTVEVPPFGHIELRTTGPATATLRVGYGGSQGLSVFRDEDLQIEVFDSDGEPIDVGDF